MKCFFFFSFILLIVFTNNKKELFSNKIVGDISFEDYSDGSKTVKVFI